ncbi:4-hydroxythreonine-4-phosphate dehydrogenase PdxA [Candidatus Pelagibacter ubique]|uniref:4-hydroxythreonine-4-phosphate dehydrogenase PdxA n=1 Tax=Pelagibacter ubique TaxID=198252 RepID=UPI0003C7EB29
MKNKPIIIINGEPNSIFLEIFFKTIKYNKFKSPLILISSLKILKLQMKKLKFKNNINLIEYKDLKKNIIDNKSINLINVEYKQKKVFEKISSKSNSFIKNSFDIALDILKEDISNKFINGPISKKSFLNKNYLGITEYLTKKTNSKKTAMLIYNKNLSVCPLTTHLPLKMVAKKISKDLIYEKVSLINNFYKKNRRLKPKIAILGLNPHCESVHKFNEDEKILKPAIKNLFNQGYKIYGPFSADTFFLKDNRKKFDVVIGMYHDQVLTPFKTIFEYNAINITLGLPFIRVSPDHGPNEKMMGKNISNPQSLIEAINFLDKN